MRGKVVSEELRGILLMVIAVSLYGGVDGLSKILAETQSIGQIVWSRYALALPILLATTNPRRWQSVFRTARPGLHVLRGVTPLAISVGMVLGVHYLPLAEATVILFSGPFLVVLLSAPLLGERVRKASWIGVVVGFAAVMLVARPGFTGVSHYAVFPLLAAIFYALFQVLTRKLGIAGERPETTLAWTLAVGTLASTPFALVELGSDSTLHLGSHDRARRRLRDSPSFSSSAPSPTLGAGVLAPFSYTQIIAATIFGVVVFGDVPDMWTFIGIAMIVGAGMFVMHSQTTR